MSSAAATPEDGRLGRRLLQWFDAHRRDLPWRRDRTPYRVWVAEIMLQQTRVDTVVPFYERFLQAFPDVAALAAASEGDVLKLWEGLGYYRRARHLHRAAREVVARYGGRLPSDPAALRTLPGVGPYTAGAVASIAFNVPTPAVDGNVLRVVARLAGIEEVVTTAAARRRVEERVRAMTPPQRAGAMTEALMELGALVCRPRSPDCAACPWQDPCVARRRGLVDELPRRPRRTRPRIVHGAVAVVSRQGEVAVRRRPPDGLLAGMWEFPWVELEAPAAAERAERTLVRALAADYGLDARLIYRPPDVRHVFSHVEWRLRVFVGEGSAAPGRDGADESDLRWMRPDGLAQLPFGRAHRRIAQRWLREEGTDNERERPRA